MTIQYLIDSENVGDFWIPLLELPAQDTELIVFYTRNSPHMSYDSLIRLKESDRTVTFIKCYEGTNALDFQLVSELGYRISKDEDGSFIIVTNDTGFDAAVKYWRRRKKSVKRITGKECKNIERRLREDLSAASREAHSAAVSARFISDSERDEENEAGTEAVRSDAVPDNEARPSRPNLRDAERASQPDPEESFQPEDSDYLTNAGETLFGNTKPVPLKVGIFATNEKLTFLDMKIYEDNIVNLLRIAEEYILKNIRWRNEITGVEREEIPEIPVAVIREVLANSFAHAIYNGRTSHEICIHPGMITVYSPGEYASVHMPEEYIKGNIESEIRNATIAKILYLSKYIEQFGSGFKRIHSLCTDAGIKYSYENGKNGFKFVLYRPQLQSDMINVTLDVTLNGTEMAVLAILKQKPDSSREEVADKISKTVRTVQRALDSLRDKGYIQRVGSKQTPMWEVLK